jgi:uncharacterized protein YegL
MNLHNLDLHRFHTHDIPPPAAVVVQRSVNHVFIVDCSGSMWGELEKLREHVKSKLFKLLKAGDTLSLIWFSSRGQYGVILKGEKIATLDDLTSVYRKVDQELVARGATSFSGPIEEAARLIQSLSSNGNAANVMFLSDGYHNDGSRDEVLKAVKLCLPHVDSAAVVEYGYYADRAFLAQMATVWNAPVLFANKFEDYAPAIERAVTRVVSGEYVQVDLGTEIPVEGIVVGLLGEDPVAYAATPTPKGFVASIPKGVASIAWVSRAAGPLTRRWDKEPQYLTPEYYALASVLALRGSGAAARDLVNGTGDKALIDQFSNAFGKQAISTFAAQCVAIATGKEPKNAKGYDPTYGPPANAATIPQLLAAVETFGLRVSIDLSEYKRMSRERVDANLRLTKEEQAELDTLKSQLEGEKDAKKVAEVSARISALANKPEPLKFEETVPELPGYPINGLVFNEDRPNVSIRVVRNGFVDLSGRLPKEYDGKVPAKFPTYTFRNYNIARDGIVNTPKITVHAGNARSEFSSFCAMLSEFLNNNRLSSEAVIINNDAVELNLLKIPLVNLEQVSSPSAAAMGKLAVETLELQGQLKVLKALLSEVADKKSEGFAAIYGTDAAKWLSDQGIVSYSGFNPKVLQTESTDSYEARVLKVKIAGFSSLPSLKDAQDKDTPSARLMKPTLKKWDKIDLHSPKNKAKIEAEIKSLTEEVRLNQLVFAQQKYSILVGNAWFNEFKSFDENTLEVQFSNGHKAKATFELTTVTEKI